MDKRTFLLNQELLIRVTVVDPEQSLALLDSLYSNVIVAGCKVTTIHFDGALIDEQRAALRQIYEMLTKMSAEGKI